MRLVVREGGPLGKIAARSILRWQQTGRLPSDIDPAPEPSPPPARASPADDGALHAPSGARGWKREDGTRTYVKPPLFDPAWPLDVVLERIRALHDGKTPEALDAAAQAIAARCLDPKPMTVDHYRRAAAALSPDRLAGLVRDLEEVSALRSPAKLLSRWLSDAMPRPSDREPGA